MRNEFNVIQLTLVSKLFRCPQFKTCNTLPETNTPVFIQKCICSYKMSMNELDELQKKKIITIIL